MPELNNDLVNQMGRPSNDGGVTVSDIFNQQYKQDQSQLLGVAHIVATDRDYNRRPDYWLHVFNISNREFIVRRPPDFPLIKIKACPKGDPWTLALRVGDTVRYKFVPAETGSPAFFSISGERWACDIINPANLGDKMWQDVTNLEIRAFHGSDDLSVRGVFWSRNEQPSAEELHMARTRMEGHYRAVVQDAEEKYRDGKAKELGEEHHAAADYLHINAPWHVKSAVQEPCPNCGEMINPGIAYHPSAVGGVCVIDWPRTVRAGVKRRDEVPEGLWPDAAA